VDKKVGLEVVEQPPTSATPTAGKGHDTERNGAGREGGEDFPLVGSSLRVLAKHDNNKVVRLVAELDAVEESMDLQNRVRLSVPVVRVVKTFQARQAIGEIYDGES
jgi:hypothetical protein